MNLTHLVLFSFYNGAGSSSAVVTTSPDDNRMGIYLGIRLCLVLAILLKGIQ